MESILENPSEIQAYIPRICGGMEGVGIGVTDVENLEEYRPGGYHPVTPGDVLGGRLVILH